MPEEPPSGWRAWFPSLEDRAAKRRERIEDLAKTDSVRARLEIAAGVVAIIAVVVIVVVNVVR